jgi:hypothetical protein
VLATKLAYRSLSSPVSGTTVDKFVGSFHVPNTKGAAIAAAIAREIAIFHCFTAPHGHVAANSERSSSAQLPSNLDQSIFEIGNRVWEFGEIREFVNGPRYGPQLCVCRRSMDGELCVCTNTCRQLLVARSPTVRPMSRNSITLVWFLCLAGLLSLTGKD